MSNLKSFFSIRLVGLAFLVVLLSSFLHPLEVFLFSIFNKYSFLFTEGIDQYKLYYSSFYYVLFIFSRIVKYGFPLLLIFNAIYVIFKIKNKGYFKLSTHENSMVFLNRVIAFLVVTYFFEIAFYLFLREQWTDFSEQLWFTRYYLIVMLVACVLLILFNFNYLFRGFKSYLLNPILPFSLSMFRILFFGYSIFLYAVVFYIGFSSQVGLSPKKSLPYIGYLIDVLPVTPMIYKVFCVSGAIISFFIMIGYKTRFFLLLNTIVVFYVVATPNFFGKLWHMQIVIWISWIMAFSDCYDIWSIDSLRKGNVIQKKSAYGFPLKVLFLHFGMIYFFAGFYKLWMCGWDWALSDSMVNQMYLEWYENYNKIPDIRIDKFPVLLHIGGVLVILFELLFPLLIIQRNLKWIAVFGGLFMHNVIGYFMYISFSTLLQAFYMVFIPWNKFVEIKNKVIDFDSENIEFSFKKVKYFIPLGILSMNFLAGVFNVNSYPFSIYPVYAAIVPENTKNFLYVIKDVDFSELDIVSEAKKTWFRWESFSRIETPLIDVYEEKGVLDTSAVIDQWSKWKNGVPILKNIDSVDVYFVNLYLKPEKMKDTIYCKKVLELYDEK